MDVRLLGPVEASVDGRAVAVGAGKPRALLALLALHAGSTVSSERLIDGLWGERPPATAVKLVQLHVSQLRKALGAGADPHARARLRAAARRPRRQALRAARGRPADRARRSPCGAGPRSTTSPASPSPPPRSAGWRSCGWRPSSWRSSSTCRGPAPRGGRRARAARARGTAAGDAARAADAGAVPLRPAGRRARGVPLARTTLVERIGVEPGPELRRLHQAILHQDPSLEPSRRHACARSGACGRRPLATERPALRAVEDDLADGIVELQARREPVRPRRRRRASARSRAWPRSTSRTRTSSSAASGSSPSWSPGSPAPR